MDRRAELMKVLLRLRRSAPLGLFVAGSWISTGAGQDAIAFDDPRTNASVSSSTPADSLQESGVVPLPVLGTEEIEQLVRDLGAAEFSVRETATQRLWGAGDQVIPALEKVANHPDREVASRANWVLERFRWGLTNETPADFARLIRSYYLAAPAKRLEIGRGLVGERRIDELLHLLDREQDNVVRGGIEIAVIGQLEAIVGPMLVEGETARAERTLERFSIENASQFLHIRALAQIGPEALESLIERSESLDSEDRPDRAARLRMLAFAELGEFDRAIDETNRFINIEEARGARFSLMLASGRWRELLDEILADSQTPDDWSMLDASRLQTAAWASRALGDATRYEALRTAFHQQMESQGNWLQQVLFESLLGDADRAVEIARQKDVTIAAYLRAGQDRYSEAFEVAGIGSNEAERRAWFESFLGELQQSDGVKPIGEPPLEPATKLKLAIEACGWLFSVGEREEGAEFLERVLTSLPDNFPQRRLFEQRILAIEYTNEANELFVQHGLRLYGRGQFATVFSEMRVSTAVPKADYNAWWLPLEQELNAPGDRYPLVRNLVGESHDRPMSSEEVLRLVEIAYAYYQDPDHRTPGLGWRMALASTCQRFGLQTRGEQILREGLEQEADAQCGNLLIEQLRQRESWEQVIEVCDQVNGLLEYRIVGNRTTMAPERPALDKAYALGRLGRNEESQELQRITGRSHLSPNRLMNLGQAFEEFEMLEQARTQYRACRLFPSSLPTSLFGSSYLEAHQYLCFARTNEPSPISATDVQPVVPLILTSGRPFFLVVDPGTAPLPTYLLLYHETATQANAWEAIQAGDWARVERELLEGVATRCGNVDNVLEFVDVLEQSGHSDILDRVMQANRDALLAEIDHFPDSALHLNNLAWLCAKSNRDLELAHRSSLRATELRPFEHNYIDTLAEVEFRLGNIERAIELARQAVAMDPLYPHYRAQLTRFEQALTSSE